MKEAKVSQMQDDQFLTGNPTVHSRGPFVGSALVAFADPLPNVPAMVGTKLQLELLLQESLVDLSAVSEVILSDAGRDAPGSAADRRGVPRGRRPADPD